MIRRPPRSTLFPYTTLFRSPVFDNQPCISMGELAIAPSDTLQVWAGTGEEDRKSTRLNSSHDQISYAVFCLKKKNKTRTARVSQDMGSGSTTMDGNRTNCSH